MSQAAEWVEIIEPRTKVGMSRFEISSCHPHLHHLDHLIEREGEQVFQACAKIHLERQLVQDGSGSVGERKSLQVESIQKTDCTHLQLD